MMIEWQESNGNEKRLLATRRNCVVSRWRVKGAGRDSSSCYLLAISCLKGIDIYVAIKI
jgi:hypothetical protein